MQHATSSPHPGNGHAHCGLPAQFHTLANGLQVVVLEDHSAPVRGAANLGAVWQCG